MKLEILGPKIGSRPRLKRLIELRITRSLRRFSSRIRRVIVRLEAEKSPKKVQEKNCSIEVDLASRHKIYVKSADRHVGRAVALASKRAAQSVRKQTEKIKDLRAQGA